MTQYAVAPKGCCGYLTPGKRYKIEEWEGEGGFFIDGDNYNRQFCLTKNCAHLRGQDWTIINSEDNNMTPCEKLGYKAGDEFVVTCAMGARFYKGQRIKLKKDDGTRCPMFSCDPQSSKNLDSYGCIFLDRIKPLTQQQPTHLTDRLEAARTALQSARAEFDALESEHKVAYPWLYGEQAVRDLPPEEWKAGDLVEVLSRCGVHNQGDTCKIIGKDEDGDIVLEGDEVKSIGWSRGCLKFHSRPAR